jgi:hypothetical protein
MQFLKTNTATRISVGPFLDKTDGVTPETALTVSNCKITVMAETDDNSDPTLVLDNVAGNDATNTLTHVTGDDAGYYNLRLTAANLNRLGRLRVQINDAANHCPVFHDYTILPANAYDAMVNGTGVGLRSDMQGYLGTAAAAADTAGYAKVTVKNGSGTGEISLSSGQVSISSSSETSIASKVWDEASSSHVAAGSFGAALFVIRSNTAQAGSGTTITLDAGASATNDFYANQLLSIVSGTGVGQGRIVTSYVGATKVATVSAWAVNPDNTSRFVIQPLGSIPGASAPTAAQNAAAVWDEAASSHVTASSFGQLMNAFSHRTGTAQAGSSLSITLDAGASATDNRYNYNYVSILSGTGFGQTRQITAYVGSTKVATVNLAWTVNPASDSVFFILPGGLDAATVASIASGVWAATRASNQTAGTFGEFTFSDAIRFSGDSTAADNAESFFDGTGYAGTNNVIPSVTTVTGNVNGNVSGSVANVLAIAANAVNASALATDAVTEIQTGLATAAALSTAQTDLTTIKGKTNSLTFTVGGQVDANIQYINDAAVTGIGSAGNPWGP